MDKYDREGISRQLASRLDGLSERLGARLRPLLRELLERHHFGHGDLFHPLGQPVVPLPMWVAEYIEATTRQEVPRSLLDDLVEATVVGYLYVRAQDDFMDGRIGAPAPVMLLADSLLFRHAALLGRRVGGSQRFWEFHEEKALAYADAMLFERQLLEPGSNYGAEQFELVLRRSAPLILPAAALLELFDRWEELPRLDAYVHHVVRSGQLIDDLRDAVTDFDTGNFSWVVRQMGGLESRQQLLQQLSFGGGFGEIIDLARADVDQAQEMAAAMGLLACLPWLDARRQAMTDMHQSFLRQLFTIPEAGEGASR